MKKTNEKIICINILLYGVFAIYMLLLIVILFRTQHQTRSINLIPFRGIVSYLSGEDLVSGKENTAVLHAFMLSNLLGNIVIFIPLGVYVTIFTQGKTIYKNTVLILFVSALVEIIQFTFKFGIGDVDDVILNTVGGLIGCTLCRLAYLICKDDYKVRFFMALFAPVAGAMCFVILILYNR